MSGVTRSGVHDRENVTRTFKIGSTIVFLAGRRLDSIDETVRIMCLNCNKPSLSDCGNRASASATEPGVRSTFALMRNLVHTGTRRFPLPDRAVRRAGDDINIRSGAEFL